MSGLRGTLVLLLLVIALVVGLQLVGGRPAEPGQITQPALGGRPLLSARRITLRPQPDVAPIELERGDTLTFRVTEPVRDIASEARLELIASVWDTARLTRVHEPDALSPELLAQLGLAPAQGELVAAFDGETVRLELGAEGPLGRTVWIRKDGAVWQGGLALLTSIGGTPDDFREHRLFRTPGAAVHVVELVRRQEGERTRLVVRRTGMGAWEIVEPLRARADAGAAEALVGALLGMAATDFAHGNVRPRPEKPDVEIVLGGDAGREEVKLWPAPGGMFTGYQTPRELDFVLDANSYQGLLELPVERLRSSLLFTVPPDQIAEITVDQGAGGAPPLVLRRGGMEVFEMVAPVRAPTHPTAVNQLLEGLRLLSAVRFVEPGADLAALGLDDDFVAVQIVGKMQGRAQIVHLGPVQGDVCYAKRADEPHVVAVPALCGESLRRPWTDYVARDVYEVLAERIFAVRYRRGEEVRAFERGEHGWVRSGGGDAPDELADTVHVLADMRADAVLDPAAVGDLGPPLEIDLLDGSGNVLQTFAVWERDGRALVRVRRVDVLFRLGRSDSGLVLAVG